MLSNLIDVKEWLRTNGAGPLTDATVTTAWSAAEAFVAERCEWDVDEVGDPPPAALVLAVHLLTARYLARRNTATGIVGIDELGGMAMPGIDPDVLRLMNPWRRVVIA